MKGRIDKLVYKKAIEACDYLVYSIDVFKKLLEDISFPSSTDYYQARKVYKDGENLYHEVIKNARKYLGPMPDYASDEFEKWREELRKESHIVAKGKDFEDVRKEIINDELLRKYIDGSEIEVFLLRYYKKQNEGKRKLENIKARLMIKKLQELLTEVGVLEKKARQLFL